jgi:CheY-like chemotaxis protein
MAVSSTDNLRNLLENIKSLGFFDRLFGWDRIGHLNAAAGNELRTIIGELNALYAQNEQAEIRIRQLYSDLENQKNQYSRLRKEHDSLKNSTGNIHDVLDTREQELGMLKESEQKNARRLVELENECGRLRSVIDRYIQLFQEKENELGALKEADSKNTQRITELRKESDKLQAALEQFTQRLQGQESGPGAMRPADPKNARKPVRSHIMPKNAANPDEKRILLVEDDVHFSQMLETLLMEIGYTVVGIAVSGEEALALASGENRVDVILIDIHIEGDIDGIETARQIKELYSTPTIFMTAQPDDESIRRVVLTESEGYLVKPINRQELFANLEIAIHKKRKNDAFTGGRRVAVSP